MRRKSIRIIFLLITLIILALLSLFVVARPRQIDLSYDSSPQKVIMYSDLRSYGGIPSRNEPACLGQTFPSLRVWGDGMIFYENWETGQSGPSYWSGHLTPDQIHSLLASLATQGFFSGWTPEMVNPAGQFLNFGVHITKSDVTYTGQEVQPPFYNQLIEQIMPHLQPVDQQTMTDFRIASLIAKIQSCVYTIINTPIPQKSESTPQNTILLPTPNQYPYPMINTSTPYISPTPLTPLLPTWAVTPAGALDLDLARYTLLTFFTLLHDRRYAEAVPLYGGSYDSMRNNNPLIPPDDYVSLWKGACTVQRPSCLAVADIVEEETVAQNEYKFLVEFIWIDGTLYKRGPCCGATETEMPPEWQFPYTVKIIDGQYKVMEEPVLMP